jgi:hypothetical protein
VRTMSFSRFQNRVVVALALLLLCGSAEVRGADLWFASQDDLVALNGAPQVHVGSLPGGGNGFAATPGGGVWVASRDLPLLRRFDALGNLELEVIPAAPLQGIALAADGTLWCARPTLDDVWHVAADGGDLGSHPVGSVPYGVAVDRDGFVWVSNSYGNSVTRLDPVSGATTTTPVGFFPTHLGAAPDGTIWVAEKESVTRLDAAGGLLGSADAFGFPLGLTFTLGGEVWVAQQNSHEVLRFDAGGALLGSIPTAWRPRGISARGDGTVEVLCRLGGVVQRFDADGVLLGEVASATPDGLGDLTGLGFALCVDPTGDADGDGVSNALEAQLGFDPLSASSSPATFVRGDANRDGLVLFEDVIGTLAAVLGGGAPVLADCPEALDVNDDAALDLADPIYLISFLFAGGPAPQAPFPVEGPDPAPGLGYPCLP